MQLSQGHDLQFRANLGCTYSVFKVKFTRHNFFSNLQTTKSIIKWKTTNKNPPNIFSHGNFNFFLLLNCKYHDTAVLLHHIFRNGGNAGFKHSMSRWKEGVDHRCHRTALSSNGLTPLQMVHFHIFNLDLLLFWYDLPLVHQT